MRRARGSGPIQTVESRPLSCGVIRKKFFLVQIYLRAANQGWADQRGESKTREYEAGSLGLMGWTITPTVHRVKGVGT